MRKLSAILLGKFIRNLTRIFRIGGGSAAPGLYALRVYPELIKELTKGIKQNIIITGTNGKTTTSRLISHFAKAQGLKVIRNHTGSNLERGIASTIIEGVRTFHLEGGIALHMSFDLGIWEVDETAFNTLAPKINPDIVIFLNASRDQLDRYGEIDSVVKKWAKTLKSLDKKTVVLVNGDDLNTNRLKGISKGEVLTFGVRDFKIAGEGFKETNINLDFEAKNIQTKGLEGSSFLLSTPKSEVRIKFSLPGIYNIYNFIAAFAVGYRLGFTQKDMLSSLKSFLPAFGRVERFQWTPREGTGKMEGLIFLIKNPAGATQVFQTIAPEIKKEDRLLLALNDNLADGTDVSWIWDAQWEILSKPLGVLANTPPRCIISGTRAYDLANRLKYAGWDPKKIMIESDLKKAFKEAQKHLEGRLFILLTYTAMLELQSILTKSGLKKDYWREE